MKITLRENKNYFFLEKGDKVLEEHKKNVKVLKDYTYSTRYKVLFNDKDILPGGFDWSESTLDGTPFASQSAFEDWIYENTGFRTASGGSGAGSVNSVTGDGVGGTPEDVVLTFPTPSEIGALDKVFADYTDTTAMIAAQASQEDQVVYAVADASDDSNITFSPTETRRQAFYRYNGVATGSIDDYTLISVPYGNSGGIDLEGYSEIGTKTGGDLVVTLGDFNNSGNNTKVEIDDTQQKITVFGRSIDMPRDYNEGTSYSPTINMNTFDTSDGTEHSNLAITSNSIEMDMGDVQNNNMILQPHFINFVSGTVSSTLRHNHLAIEDTFGDGSGISLEHSFFDFNKGNSSVRITWDDLEDSSFSYLKLPKIDDEVTETIATQEWVSANGGGGVPKEEEITGTAVDSSVNGAETIDLSVASHYNIDVLSNSTITFTGLPAVGKSYTRTLIAESSTGVETLSFANSTNEFGSYDPSKINFITVMISHTSNAGVVINVFYAQAN